MYLLSKIPELENTHTFELFKSPVGIRITRKYFFFKFKDRKFGGFPKNLNPRIKNNHVYIIAITFGENSVSPLVRYNPEG